jgi:2-C-methyl-D-erythritol 4-phosphate cytidylyltransferase
MGNEKPKQFLLLKGKELLWHSVKAFKDAFEDVEVIVVAPTDHIERAQNVCSEFEQVQFVEGGASRFTSVKNGLQQVKEDSVVFVHDAVRCLVSKELIVRCYEQAVEKGSAIPSVAAHDSIRMMDGDSHKVIDRNLVRIIQTPQTFRSEIILPAFEVDECSAFTDEATVVEAYGGVVHLIEGEHTNIKITRPIDLLIAEKILEERANA